MTDAVVIGSGPNGLAAAIRLAEAGCAVTVLETAAEPGGAVRTEELTLPGFRHDTFSSVYPAAAASPVFERMGLAEYGLEWVHPKACSAHPVAGDQAVVLYRDVEQTARSLDTQHRGDGAKWSKFVRPYLESFDAVRATMLSGFPPAGGPLKLVAGAGPLRAAQFARLLPGTAAGLGKRLFDGDASRAWLSSAAMHGDTPPDGAGSAIAAFYLNLLGHAVGWPSPRGGAEQLTTALVARLTSLGGTIRISTTAERIVVNSGRVSGVALDSGDELPAVIVIATVMPEALVGMAGDALSGWYRKGLRRYVPGPATVKVDWALDGQIRWANEDVREAGTVHVGGSTTELAQSIAASQHGWPDRPFLLLGQQSVADPTRAPAGKHTAWAYTHGPNGSDWPSERERHLDAIEQQVERYAPGFRDSILARHVLGPADLEARDANLVGGDVGGGSYKLRQVIFRPVPTLTPYNTTVGGLFLGSAAAFPGGAVHGVPGDAAARAALRRI